MQLYNALGQIDLACIDPVEVGRLSDAQQVLLAQLVEKVQAREAAQTRYTKAVEAVGAASQEQAAALAAHVAANPPQTFAQARSASIDSFNKSH